MINRDFSSNNELFLSFNEFNKFKIVHEDTTLYFNKNRFNLAFKYTFKVNSKAMFYFENVFNHLNNAKTVLSDTRMHSKFDLTIITILLNLKCKMVLWKLFTLVNLLSFLNHYFKLNKESNVYITTVNLLIFFL